MVSVGKVALRVGGIFAVLLLATGLGCRDAAAPKSAELSGEYVLVRVGDRTLPILRKSYGEAGWDELDRASLRFLSRTRVVAASTIAYRRGDGTLYAESSDTLVFNYVRSGDLLDLTLRDFRGLHHDTLALERFGSDSALRVTSSNYVQKDLPAPLVANGIYIKRVQPNAHRRFWPRR